MYTNCCFCFVLTFRTILSEKDLPVTKFLNTQERPRYRRKGTKMILFFKVPVLFKVNRWQHLLSNDTVTTYIIDVLAVFSSGSNSEKYLTLKLLSLLLFTTFILKKW